MDLMTRLDKPASINSFSSPSRSWNVKRCIDLTPVRRQQHVIQNMDPYSGTFILTRRIAHFGPAFTPNSAAKLPLLTASPIVSNESEYSRG